MRAHLRMLWVLIVPTWQSWLIDRAFFFLLAFGWMMPLLVSLFVWMTAAEGRTIGGMSQGEIVAYYLISIPVNQLTYAQTHWTVGDAIRDGRLSAILLRPIAPIFQTIADELAGKMVFMLFVLPLVLILSIWLRPEMSLTFLNLCAFVPALVLAWMLRFLWGYWIALHAFWAVNASSLLSLDSALLFLFAGQLAPIPFLPGIVQDIARVLPYRYMLGFPVELLMGKLSAGEMLSGFAWQIFWIVCSLVLSVVLWRQGVRRYTAVGG